MEKELKNLTVPQFRTVEHPVEMRATEDGGEKNSVFGYAAKFNSETVLYDFGDEVWIETIDPGFFDDVMGDDVRALNNHGSDKVYARTKSGTLRIGQDEVGLWYQFKIRGNRSYSLDLKDELTTGDVDQSSFGFMLKQDGFSYEEKDVNGVWTVRRTLLKGGCKTLLDVSPVTYPAYESTEVGLNSVNAGLEHFKNGLAEFRNKNKPADNAKKADISKELIELEILGL